MTDTNDALLNAAKKGGRRGSLFGVLTVVVGFLCLGAPLVAGASVALFVGFLVLFGGVTRLVGAFQAESFGKGTLKFLLGGLTLVAGLLMVTSPLLGLASLTLMLAAYFVVEGIFEIAAALQLRPEQGWGWVLFGGVVSLLLGLMIWRQFPLSGAWAIGALLGIHLITAGFAMIMVGTTVRKMAKAAESA
jgi:uncharacterized membrane protein HdeD (DUF308 family)